MKRILTAIAAVVLTAASAQATTFSSLTLIYTGVGVVDFDGTPSVGTSVVCVNQSGLFATVRWRYFSENGAEIGTSTAGLPNGLVSGVGTANGTFSYLDAVFLGPASNFNGRVVVYSTQSAVFCHGVVADSEANDPGNSLHMVRFNAHPGTVE